MSASNEVVAKFFRSRQGLATDYGKKFSGALDNSVGGISSWDTTHWSHGVAPTLDGNLRIRRCEDGPEFYLNAANSLAACGSFLVSVATLWLTTRSRPEKAQNGDREVRFYYDGVTIVITATKRKRSERILRRLLTALK